MVRKWLESDEIDGPGAADDDFEGPVPDRYYLVQKHSPQITYKIYDDLVDTIICSHTRAEELRRLMNEKPFEERSTILPSDAVNHNTIYYVDMRGWAYRYFIEED